MELLERNSRTWMFLNNELRQLVIDGENIIEIAGNYQTLFSDYSFTVFPFAKAYEGFLKELFYKMDFISDKEYLGSHFRIGKALNPGLEKRFRFKESVYDKIVSHCGGRGLADEMWRVWKQGRNLIFHYFPHNYQAKNIEEAKLIITEILTVMEKGMEGCKLNV